MKYRSNGVKIKSVNQLLQEFRLRSSAMTIRDLIGKDSESASVRDQLAVLFTEWVRLYHHPASNEKSHLRFITQVSTHCSYNFGFLPMTNISPNQASTTGGTENRRHLLLIL